MTVPATSTLIVTKYAPELACVDPQVLEQIVADTALLIEAAAYGVKYTAAHAYLAAHWAALHFGTVSAKGAVSSRRVDKIQESYAVPTVALQDLGDTPFGREFLRIRRSLRRAKAFSSRASDWDLPDGRVI